MNVFVEYLKNKEAIGKVFLSYSSDDSQDIKNYLINQFDNQDIPYFFDKIDIEGGQNFLSRIEKAIDASSCGVIILSENSLKSKWLFFEVGYLLGRYKSVIPFLLHSSKWEIIKPELPEFISNLQIEKDLNKLIQNVNKRVFLFRNFFDDTQLNEQVFKSINQTRLTVVFKNFPYELLEKAVFGVLIIRFGEEKALSEHANERYAEEGRIINKAITSRKVITDKVLQSQHKDEVKVDYIIPIHKKLGVQFKPFIEIDTIYRNSIMEVLKENEVKEQKLSGSPEKQRIYYLFPEGSISETKSPEGIINHILYPE